MEENPFGDLKIWSREPLEGIEGRVKCPNCNRSRKFYCYACGAIVQGAGLIPKVKLPVKVDIIRHRVEESGKNTAIHAAVLAPDDVAMYTWPDVPDYEDKSKLVVVFPSPDSMTLTEYVDRVQGSEAIGQNKPVNNDGDKPDTAASSSTDDLDSRTCEPCDDESTISNESVEKTNSKGKSSAVVEDEVTSATLVLTSEKDSCDVRVAKKHGLTDYDELEVPRPKMLKTDRWPPFERVIFVDATWHYVNRLGRDEKLAGVKHIILRPEVTKFWRYQHKKPETYLSTIEAIYYFFREYHKLFIGTEYVGEYDNLLFLFVMMYERIRKETQGGQNLKIFRQNTETVEHS